ncbi:MAG: DUF2788 domain-containing protein [Gammaproteobacteria bacterium]|nr:DUF2788 domain-containing protein [Gammaproteobacteria bacterium]MBU1654707.1 DUF2788 domain-containing protein [Gammaproteobacteria bacterium]MBU1959628.1 DUF2788 domain-containing protein [Gammaproteobacteria bacterium]
MTIEQFESLSLTFGLTLLIGYMLFIIWQLARESKAGRLGTFILFLVLATGILEFIGKEILQFFLDP